MNKISKNIFMLLFVFGTLDFSAKSQVADITQPDETATINSAVDLAQEIDQDIDKAPEINFGDVSVDQKSVDVFADVKEAQPDTTSELATQELKTQDLKESEKAVDELIKKDTIPQVEEEDSNTQDEKTTIKYEEVTVEGGKSNVTNEKIENIENKLDKLSDKIDELTEKIDSLKNKSE